MKWTPRRLRWALNIYGPYLGAGIRVTHIAEDWREIHVRMDQGWYNTNAVGVHFGGSLYAMVDPQIMLMLMQLLGKDYWVWDKAAEIEFIKPGKGRVESRIRITDEDIRTIKTHTAQGQKYFPRFSIPVTDSAGQVVAKVIKILYVRRKNGSGGNPPD